jgi:hypothetical protein
MGVSPMHVDWNSKCHSVAAALDQAAAMNLIRLPYHEHGRDAHATLKAAATMFLNTLSG